MSVGWLIDLLFDWQAMDTRTVMDTAMGTAMDTAMGTAMDTAMGTAMNTATDPRMNIHMVIHMGMHKWMGDINTAMTQVCNFKDFLKVNRSII